MQPIGRRTELIWEGKYDASGKRVAPLRVQLPFQTVEMVNESAQERQRALSLFESSGTYLAKEWRRRPISNLHDRRLGLRDKHAAHRVRLCQSATGNPIERIVIR
jgi:hypothetical protein